MRWEFGDGTVLLVGPKRSHVEGESPLADQLGRDLAAVRAGYGVPVQVEMHPSAPRALSMENAALVDTWARAAATRFDVTVTSAPEVEPVERMEQPDPPGASTVTVY